MIWHSCLPLGLFLWDEPLQQVAVPQTVSRSRSGL